MELCLIQILIQLALNMVLSLSSLLIFSRICLSHRCSEPPDPFPNSEVKPLCADGSVGLPM